MISRLYFYSYLMVALFFSMTSVAFGQAQAPAPAFKEGDTWQLKFEQQGQQQGRTSTDQLEGIFEIKFTQGGFKLSIVA